MKFIAGQCLPYINKEVIISQNNTTFIGTLRFINNKLYWKVKNNYNKFIKYKLIIVNESDIWMYNKQDIDISCFDLYELIQNIDILINELDTKYESFGLGNKQITTSDNKYQITGIWGMVNVKILDTDKSYNLLLERLRKHYKGNKVIKEIFICKYGTIMLKVRDIDFDKLKNS